MTDGVLPGRTRLDLYWLPLGAGDPTPLVRWCGGVFEAIAATHDRRPRCQLYHSALEVFLDDRRWVIEMGPVWDRREPGRGVVGEGPVGLAGLGRWRLFRYEVRRWHDGVLPDRADAVAGAHHVATDERRVTDLLGLVESFPTATWGRDELGAGEMWNSNSLVSWLLASSRHDTATLGPPARGRAPGWDAGLVVAARHGLCAPA